MFSKNTTSAECEAPTPLVTGDRGFLGQHFCSRYGGTPFADAAGHVELRDAARVKAAVAALRPEAVLHLAAQSSVASSLRDPAETYATNFLGTSNLLEALHAVDFRGCFVFISSADVYGRVDEVELPVRETRQPLPRNPYAVSKVAGEALCYQWSQTGNFRVVVVRPFNQIGPGQDRRFALPDFAAQIHEIARGSRPPVMTTGDLEVTRDFTDARDTVRALRLLLDGGANGETYNLCSGRERTLRSLVEEMLDLANVKAELRVDPERMRPVEQRRMVGDFSKINEHTGWSPGIPIRETLKEILKKAEVEEHV